MSHEVRTLVSVAMAIIVSSLLPFMLGGLAFLVRADLGFNEVALGVSIAAFGISTSLSSVPGGFLSERIGPRAAVLTGATTSVVALLGIALLAQSWLQLTLFLMLGGAARGVTQPAANLMLSREIAPSRQGMAYGVKQSAMPMASMIAGIALPTIGLTIGWRWAFGLAAVLYFVFAALLPRASAAPARKGGSHRGRHPIPARLVLLAAGATSGLAAAGSLTAFLVESVLRNGIEAGDAGLLLAGGSAVAVVTRLVVGIVSDKWSRDNLLVVAGMMAIGAPGYLILALSGNILLIALGTAMAFGGGWGWSGVLTHAVVRHHADAPGVATGVTQAGIAAGLVIGPPIFGLLVTSASFLAAWSASSVFALLGCLLILIGRSWYVAEEQSRESFVRD